MVLYYITGQLQFIKKCGDFFLSNSFSLLISEYIKHVYSLILEIISNFLFTYTYVK